MNNLPNFAVMVCEGSGCLFKTNTQEYDYVLTAKHVVEGKNDIKVTRQYTDDEGIVTEQVINVIGDPYVHYSADKDAAILKVENVDDLESLSRLEDVILNKDDCYLVGYPNSRKNINCSYRQDTLKLLNLKAHGYIEAELNKSCSYSEMVGQSGGPIIKILKGKPYLIGIQKKMSVDDEDELLSRIDLMPVTFFDEIIDSYSENLEKITQTFFECFSNLKDQAMPLNGALVENHVAFTRNYLRSITDKIVNNRLTPNFIKNFFKERLLIHNQHHRSLNHKKLWLAWLEFLIIMNIYKEGFVDDSNIEDLFNSHRLIFSLTENDWSLELENIIKSDFRGLRRDSKIIVSTSSIPVISTIPPSYVIDIIREQAVPRSEIMIDEASSYPLEGHKLIHLTAFQRDCIIAKSIEYKDYTALNENELTAKLKTEYEQLFD